MLKWRELLTTAFEMIGFDNVEKFFNPETPATQLNQMLEQVLQQSALGGQLVQPTL